MNITSLLGNRVLVERQQFVVKDETSKLIILDQHAEKEEQCIVVALGTGDAIPGDIEVGSRVVVSENTGVPTPIGGKTYWLFNADQIIAVYTK